MQSSVDVTPARGGFGILKLFCVVRLKAVRKEIKAEGGRRGTETAEIDAWDLCFESKTRVR